MFSRRSLPAAIAFLLVLSAVAVAQDTQTQAPNRHQRVERMRNREGRGLHGKMGRHRFGKSHLMRELNLTEAQQQQRRAIAERHLSSTKAQREELFGMREKRMAGTFTAEDEARAKALRQEIHNSMQGLHAEFENILTPEQRTKLEQLKAERKTKHEGMRKRRLERRENIPN